MAKALHAVRFPGESTKYRSARDELLREEIALRRQIEKIAEMRRTLPLGGDVKEDYVFEEGSTDLADIQTVRRARLSDLFSPHKDSLILYSFMFGPESGRAPAVPPYSTA